MIPLTRQDSDNLRQFHAVVKRTYTIAKKAGNIPAQSISVYDKLVASPAVVLSNNQVGWVRPIYAHRQWRRRVARLYHQSKGQPLRGFFDWELNWEQIQDWILENMIPIMKLLLVIVPFII